MTYYDPHSIDKKIGQKTIYQKMETNLANEVHLASEHVLLFLLHFGSSIKASDPLLSSPDSRTSFTGVSHHDIDLTLYRDIAEIYREAMAPTCVYTALRPGTDEVIQ